MSFSSRPIRRPNVLLVGHLDAAKLSTFLGEFFHPDRKTDGSQSAFYHVRIGTINNVSHLGSCRVFFFLFNDFNGHVPHTPASLSFLLASLPKKVVILSNEEPDDEVREVESKEDGALS